MSGGRDTEEFQQFFKSLINPRAPVDAPTLPFGVRDVIVNGPLRCKIYIGIPMGKIAPDAEPPTKP